MDSLRDWGYAKDYVEMQWLMLQQENPEDYVIATGLQYSVRKFLEWSALEAGIELSFEGKGANEITIVSKILDPSISVQEGDVICKVDSKYFRPAEVESLLGDASKARNKLGWKPNTSVKEMCSEMVKEDVENAKKFKLLSDNGFQGLSTLR